MTDREGPHYQDLTEALEASLELAAKWRVRSPWDQRETRPVIYTWLRAAREGRLEASR